MRYGTRENFGEPMPDPESMSDEEILTKFRELGMDVTMEEFKIEALSAGSPDVLAANWSYMLGITDHEEEDFIYAAIRTIWKRYFGYVGSVEENLAKFIDETIDMYVEHPGEHDKVSLFIIYKRIKNLYSALLRKDGSPNVELYNDLSWYTRNDFEAFLLNIPHELARHGMTDEAVYLGRWFADLSSRPGNFLRDTACILAEAGKKEEAVLQIEDNLMRFPEDIWVIINAGDAMDSLGEKKRAEVLYMKAYRVAKTRDDKLHILERIIDLYKGLGMVEKVKPFEEEYRDLIGNK